MPRDRNDALPRRVPAEQDLPPAPDLAPGEGTEPPQLARIAVNLRRDDVALPSRDGPTGFDVRAVLVAAREVDGVLDASLRATDSGELRLRLDLADDADPAEVSRRVTALLQDRIGVAVAGPASSPN
jgi:hypothetical protein